MRHIDYSKDRGGEVGDDDGASTQQTVERWGKTVNGARAHPADPTR